MSQLASTARRGVQRRVPAAVVVGAALAVLFFCAAGPSVGAQTLSAEQILRKAEQSVYPDAFRMGATIETLKSGTVESRMEMSIRYKRKVGTRIELLSPPRSRGIRFLQRQESLWMFNPAAGTSMAIRLSPRASFQGTVFSNRDVGDPQYSQQYHVHLVGTEEIEQSGVGPVKAIVIEGIARNERVAYAKVKLWVRADNYMMLKAEYYAKSGLLFKTMAFTGVKELGGAMRPTVIRMRSMDQKNKESVMTIQSLTVDPSLPDAIFSLAALTR